MKPDDGAAGSALHHMVPIDGLRGLAIALVLWHHIPHLFGYQLYADRFWVCSQGGWLGVDLFFVVSGFLITSILLRSRDRPHPLRTFWARRALRIFPLFYFYMAVVAVTLLPLGLLEAGDPLRTSFGAWLPYLTYLANFQIAWTNYPAGEFNILWSLALEEQFYLLWPFVVLAARGRKLEQLCLIVITLAPVFRVGLAELAGLREVYVLPFGRADTLMMGALLALLLEDPRRRARVLLLCRRLAPVALAVLVATVAVPFHVTIPGQHPRYWVMFGYSWVALSFTILTGAAVAGGPLARRLLGNRPLAYLGKICYGTYLWHWWAGDMLKAAVARLVPGGLPIAVMASLWLPLTVVIASASWYLLEKPVLALKARFAYPPRNELKQRAGGS